MAVPDLTVVIPAHNSAHVLTRTVERWRERLAGSDSEVIVVENGSTDGTLALAHSLADPGGRPRIRVAQSDKGMGNALRAGIALSTGRRVLLSADDLPFGFDDLDQAARLTGTPDVVIGSKDHPSSQVQRGRLRWVSTFGFKTLRRVILGSKVGDSQGTILADGDWLRRWGPAFDDAGFLFSTQLCWAAELQSLSVVEVPVRLSPEHAPTGSRVRLSDIWMMGSGLLRLRRDRRQLTGPAPREA